MSLIKETLAPVNEDVQKHYSHLLCEACSTDIAFCGYKFKDPVLTIDTEKIKCVICYEKRHDDCPHCGYNFYY